MAESSSGKKPVEAAFAAAAGYSHAATGSMTPAGQVQSFAAEASLIEMTEATQKPAWQSEVEIVAYATEVLGSARVGTWMNTKIPSLGDQTPYSLLSTEEGRKQVETVLLRIANGVY